MWIDRAVNYWGDWKNYPKLRCSRPINDLFWKICCILWKRSRRGDWLSRVRVCCVQQIEEHKKSAESKQRRGELMLNGAKCFRGTEENILEGAIDGWRLFTSSHRRQLIVWSKAQRRRFFGKQQPTIDNCANLVDWATSTFFLEARLPLEAPPVVTKHGNLDGNGENNRG